MLTTALLAGGLATRLRPITENIPKALVEVAGRPFIDWQLEAFSQQGLKRIVICMGHLGEMIKDHVGDGSRFGLEILYSSDGPTLQGTGGALRQASPLLGEHFAVVYGDSFLPVNFALIEEAYLKSNQPALMTVLLNKDSWDRSNVLFKNGVLIEYNKKVPRSDMEFIDYGISYLSASTFLKYKPLGPFDLADYYSDLSTQNLLAGYEVHERFYEIGSYHGLHETEHYFLNRTFK